MMTRTQLACCVLIASAFFLGGLLVKSLQDRWLAPAHAEMVVGTDSVTMMTAHTRPDEEALFTLDGFNEKLLIYRLDVGKRRLELAHSVDLPSLFDLSKQSVSPRRRRGDR